jgi:alkylation response protein AidB-like acyl-CoA dehydrogenase
MLAPLIDRRLGDVLNRADASPPSLAELVEAGLDRLPLPGTGRTLERWRALAAVAACDLSLAKRFEGHTDALAILAELGGADAPDGSRWGTWCAEPPSARVSFRRTGDRWSLHGTKAWCSGAADVTHAIVSCWDDDGAARLAAVSMAQAGVRITDQGWQAVGMADTASVDVHFDDAEALPVGDAGDYVARAGFWHGGAGIAACWYGGARGIADMTRANCGPRPDAHRLAHLGAIDIALAGAAAVLRETAAWIDEQPSSLAQVPALRARLVTEAAATLVLQHAGRALGAGPLCRDARVARAMADLPVFLRQSHAERDLAALGADVLPPQEAPWAL